MFFSKEPKMLSLNESRSLMKRACKWYHKNVSSFSPQKKEAIDEAMNALDQALMAQNAIEADYLAKNLQQITQNDFRRSFFEFIKELTFALLFALIIAVLVRQLWFELYEIPTGSMRPTFKELDHLSVSKTSFGINFPLETAHIYFDPSLVQRSSILIFSADKIDLGDPDTTFFWVFPYKKRVVKRCVGKPGDALYFYGGKIWGIDKDGNDLKELRENPWMEKLEYIPFITFEGKEKNAANSLLGDSLKIELNQFNHPAGRVSLNSMGQWKGEVFNGKSWSPEQIANTSVQNKKIESFSQLYGMGNFGMARILTKEQLKDFTDIDLRQIPDGLLYLEIRHHPQLSNPKPRLVQKSFGRYELYLTPFVSVLPIQEAHLKALMENMYTARFIVENERARPFRLADDINSRSLNPILPGVADGTYEFYYGKAYKIDWGGIAILLPEDHPLYKVTPSNVQTLYNLGIEWSLALTPHAKEQTFFPSRYAYYKEGNLFLLGGSVYPKEDSYLQEFLKREEAKESQSTKEKPYIAFKDYGPPMKNGKIDGDFIRTFGITVPEKSYLVLGDNHAMSGDSRVFGFLPEDNIQGAPCYILWPPGPRWGAPNQKPYPLFNFPRTLIWCLAGGITAVGYGIHRRRIRKPLFKRK